MDTKGGKGVSKYTKYTQNTPQNNEPFDAESATDTSYFKSTGSSVPGDGITSYLDDSSGAGMTSYFVDQEKSQQNKDREPKGNAVEEVIQATKQKSTVLGGDSSDGEVSRDEPPTTSRSDDVQPLSPSPAPIDNQETPTSTNDNGSTTTSPSLIGKILLSKYLITEQLRVGTTKSELFKCYNTSDHAKKYPLVIKFSRNTEQIKLEYRIFCDLFTRMSNDKQHLFARVYDFVDASPMTDGRTGFVMECGIENLRGYIWREGAYTGETLRNIMRAAIRTVHTLHGLGNIWTEVKCENLIVFGSGEIIKAIDLESVIGHNDILRAYTAETYPPEFPADMLYRGIPQIPLEYSFDVYGLGLVLFEIATGEPLYTLQKTYDVDYIRERLKSPQGIVDEANLKLQNVDPGARRIIQNCLVVDPQKRSTCDELLKDVYFK